MTTRTGKRGKAMRPETKRNMTKGIEVIRRSLDAYERYAEEIGEKVTPYDILMLSNSLHSIELACVQLRGVQSRLQGEAVIEKDPIPKVEAGRRRGISPWRGLDEFPMGETHEVLGHLVPRDVDEETLTAVGSSRMFDDYGDEILDDEFPITGMPAGEVASLLESVTGHNNDDDGTPKVSYAELDCTLALARMYAYEQNQSCGSMLHMRFLAETPEEDQLRRDEIEKQLADPDAWSLWGIASGEWLDLAPIIDDYGKERILLRGLEDDYYVLTAEGRRRVGTKEGVIPMWALILACSGTDPHGYEGVFRDITIDTLLSKELICGRYDPED